MSRARRAWRALSGPLGLVLGVGLVAVLVWRIAANLGGQPQAAGALPKGSAPVGKPAGIDQGGATGSGTLKHYDPKTAKFVLSVRFAKAVLNGDLCNMQTVEMRRMLDDGQAMLLATAREGVYNRVTGSGSLAGKVLVQRFARDPQEPGVTFRKEPDLVIRSESLAWDQAAGTLTSPAFAEMTWLDPKTSRKLVVGGTGLHTERWAETVRLGQDVRVSLAEQALPDRLPLAEKGRARKPETAGDRQAPAVTVITCAGPAAFENRTELGCRRATFLREVRAVRQDLELTCNRLELVLFPERGLSGRDGVDLSALADASAAPSAQALTARGLLRSLSVPPAPAQGPAAGRSEQGQVDSVLATGAVTMKGPEGTARGELAFYDRPGGCVWLDGGPQEPAEVMRGENQLVSQSFFFNLRTEEMSSEGRGRTRVIVKDEGKVLK